MNNQSSNNSVYVITIRLFFLVLIVAWCLMIMFPFVNIILWSLILAMALHPLHTNISKKIGGRSKLTSALIVLVIFIGVIWEIHAFRLHRTLYRSNHHVAGLYFVYGLGQVTTD